MSIIKDVTGGNEASAKEKLVAALNQKRDEVMNLARTQVQSKIFKTGDTK